MRLNLEKNALGLSIPDLERFLGKIIRGTEEECWPWLGAPDHAGYGHFTLKAWPYPAHRLAYGLANGEIPQGRQIHHKCETPICVNPHHLEALTVPEHIDKTTGHPKNLTHCKRGHEFTAENTKMYKGIRTCRACVNLRAKRKYNPDFEETSDVVSLYCKNEHPLFGSNLTLVVSPLGEVRRLCKTCRREAVHRHKTANRDTVLAQRKARRAIGKLELAQAKLKAATEQLNNAGVADPLAVLAKLKGLL